MSGFLAYLNEQSLLGHCHPLRIPERPPLSSRRLIAKYKARQYNHLHWSVDSSQLYSPRVRFDTPTILAFTMYPPLRILEVDRLELIIDILVSFEPFSTSCCSFSCQFLVDSV
jgi:hypothetical protein